MVHRNPDISRYQSDYLFVEVGRRKKKLLADQPDAKIINLGIGDTTEPIPDPIIDSFTKKAKELGTKEGYTGYGAPFGDPHLRQSIAGKIYQSRVSANDVFISDGAKCDLGRLQLLFGRESSLAIQDPSYPVYIATSVMSGKTEDYNTGTGQYKGIAYMSCKPENQFFPIIDEVPQTDLIYICSPNNPTGAVLTHKQLETLVALAHKQKSIIIFDSAYSGFIRDPSLPRSIFEVEGASEVAIEIGSFSKLAGFTGVRLGWAVIPAQLRYNDGTTVQKDWIKIASTFFNGASNLAQAGGITALGDEGLALSDKLCGFYLENAKILREAVESRGFTCYGGENAPYLWVDIKGQSSWDFFDTILKTAHIVTTPGIGFGPAGEGFLRLSAFGQRDNIKEASERLRNAL
ncbi:MAG: LL-diaminopimelate aminotransferase [Waddliaceae bacterium]